MAIIGQAQCFGDNINTDYIIAARRKTESADVRDLARYTFEDIDPYFVDRTQPGDIVVAGRNFGCGSSREGAVHVLKECGVAAVVAKSFARIFFRNAINNGLLVVECDATVAETGDRVVIDLEAGTTSLPDHDVTMRIPPMPAVMRRLVDAGGLVPFLRERKTFDAIIEDTNDSKDTVSQ